MTLSVQPWQKVHYGYLWEEIGSLPQSSHLDTNVCVKQVRKWMTGQCAVTVILYSMSLHMHGHEELKWLRI